MELPTHLTVVQYCFSCANPSLDCVGTFEHSFDFRGVQLSRPSWLENAFMPRRSVIQERANILFIETMIFYIGKEGFFFFYKHT